MADVEEYLNFNELPDDLAEEILAWLPVEYLFRFGGVCSKWNTLFSSSSFITEQWSEAPPNRKPWLLVGVVADLDRECVAYSSFTQGWKKCISVSCLEGKETENAYGLAYIFRFLGTAAGLFLMEGNTTHSLYICNPLTRKCFKLPPLTFIEHPTEGELGIVEEGKDGYRVVVVDHSTFHGQNIIEIYDSTEKEWRMAALFPRGFTLYSNYIGACGVVLCGGFLYCLALGPDEEDLGILGLNMEDGRDSIFVAVPERIDPENRNFFNLLSCGSGVVLVVSMFIETETETETREVTFEEVSWEFNKNDVVTNWKEIAKMPPRVYEDPDYLNAERRPSRLRCAGMGDCLYFKKFQSEDVAVYSVIQNSWTSISSCPIMGPPIAFEPRPDMKVE